MVFIALPFCLGQTAACTIRIGTFSQEPSISFILYLAQSLSSLKVLPDSRDRAVPRRGLDDWVPYLRSWTNAERFDKLVKNTLDINFPG
jgi:hypothetical protein